MTTFQDQPPQSRRQVRQSERENDANAQALSGPFVVQPEPVHPESAFVVPPQQSNVDDTLPPSAPAAPVSGRRARAASPSGLVDVPTTPPDGFPEPLTYTTQAKPGFPQSAPSNSPVDRSQARAEQPYRVRDFSPEGRRSASPSAFTAPAEPAPLDYRTQAAPAFTGQPAPESAEVVAHEQPATTVESSSVDGATSSEVIDAGISDQVTPVELAPIEPASISDDIERAEPNDDALTTDSSAEGSAPAEEEPVHKLDDTVLPDSFRLSAPVEPAAPQVFLSRRELRARQAAADAAAEAAAGPQAAPPLVEPESTPLANLSSAIDEFEALTRAATESLNPAAQEKAHEAGREVAEAAVANAQAEADARAAEVERAQAELLKKRETEARENASAPTADPGVTSPFEAMFTVPGDGPAPATLTTPPSQREKESPQTPASQNLAPQFSDPLSTNTGTHATSTGHWSQQAALEDELPYENTISRQVGMNNVATTTSALVLPTIPHSGEIGSIVAGTGEILVTGSIELPRSVGATGGDARRYDDPDVDSLFDSLDNEIVTTDSAPVRAIRAVSTHTSTHGVITAKKPKGNKLLIVLAGSTVGLAVAAVTLLAYATNLL